MAKDFNSLWWLWRQGSPLPIPNRVVKPDCADGTGLHRESRSPPFFEPRSNAGLFFALYFQVNDLGLFNPGI